MKDIQMRPAPREWVEHLRRVGPVDAVVLCDRLPGEGVLGRAFVYDDLALCLVKDGLDPLQTARIAIHEAMHYGLGDPAQLVQRKGKWRFSATCANPRQPSEEVVAARADAVFEKTQEIYNWKGKVEARLVDWHSREADGLVSEILACIPDDVAAIEPATRSSPGWFTVDITANHNGHGPVTALNSGSLF
jgi:hypothetical protein